MRVFSDEYIEKLAMDKVNCAEGHERCMIFKNIYIVGQQVG